MSILDKIFGLTKIRLVFINRKPRFFTPAFDSYNDFGQIASIFDYVLNPNFAIANKAAQTVHRLFETVQGLQDKQLYQTFRYIRLQKSDIKKFERFEHDVRISLLCIGSMNGNGYSREEALNQLIAFKSQKTFPFILFRLADWVIPIRKRAEGIITTFIVAENSIYFIQNHALLRWLLRVERIDLSELYDLIIHSITSNRLDLSQLKVLADGDRLFYLQLIAKHGDLDSDLVALMQNDTYYLIRILLIKHFTKIDHPQSVLANLLSDKSQKVRQTAVAIIANQNIAEYQSILEVLIFDKSASIRFEARRLLGIIREWDFKKMYADCLAENHFLVGSILGLSEVSDGSDLATIQKYLDSDSANVKTAALFGIFNLDQELAVEKAYHILETENPVSTKRAAESVLSKKCIDFIRLRNLYDTTDITGKKNILRLFNRFSGWTVAGDFLKALSDENEQIQLMAGVFLYSWIHYTVRLATEQSSEDKDYALGWYERTKELGLKVPENIPFIFGVK